MSESLLNFFIGVSNYYLGWITSCLFVYILILAWFSINILFVDKNHSHFTQDLFGLVSSYIFCVLLALIQAVIIGTLFYFVTNITEIGLIKKFFLNSLLPIFFIGYDYLRKIMNERESF